jgi:hypothetical protein
MDQLTDDMEGAMEGEQTAMTMIAHGELAPACLAPLLLDVAFEARKERVFGPAV